MSILSEPLTPSLRRRTRWLSLSLQSPPSRRSPEGLLNSAAELQPYPVLSFSLCIYIYILHLELFAMESVRVRVQFEDRRILRKSQRKEGLQQSWIMLRPHHKTVADLAYHLLHAFELQESCALGLILSVRLSSRSISCFSPPLFVFVFVFLILWNLTIDIIKRFGCTVSANSEWELVFSAEADEWQSSNSCICFLGFTYCIQLLMRDVMPP